MVQIQPTNPRARGQYRTALRKLAEGCEFATITLQEILRDRLLFGIKDAKVREHLLRESHLTLAKTDEICHAAESMHADPDEDGRRQFRSHHQCCEIRESEHTEELVKWTRRKRPRLLELWPEARIPQKRALPGLWQDMQQMPQAKSLCSEMSQHMRGE